MFCKLPKEIVEKTIKTHDFEINEIRGGISKQVYNIIANNKSCMLYIWLRPNDNELTENQTEGSDYLFADGFDFFIHNTRYLSEIGVNVPKIIDFDHYEELNFNYAFVEELKGKSFQEIINTHGNISHYSNKLVSVMNLLSEQKRNFYGSPTVNVPLKNVSAEKLAYDFYTEELRIASKIDNEIDNNFDKIISVLDNKFENITVDDNRLFTLIHGELTPPHIFLLDNGEIGLIDIEAVKFYDREYDWAIINLMYGGNVNLPQEINTSLLDFYKVCLQIGYLSVSVDFLVNVDSNSGFFKSVKNSNMLNLLKKCS